MHFFLNIMQATLKKFDRSAESQGDTLREPYAKKGKEKKSKGQKNKNYTSNGHNLSFCHADIYEVLKSASHARAKYNQQSID